MIKFTMNHLNVPEDGLKRHPKVLEILRKHGLVERLVIYSPVKIT